MKKKFYLLLFIILTNTALNVQAADIQTILSNIGFNVFAQKDAKEEIINVLDKQQNYANKKKFDKLKTLYSSTYANFDGIDINSYIDSLKKTADMHSKINYKTIINSITVNRDYATVEAVDISDGITKEPYEIIPGKGILHSEAKALYYFKKENGIWKIDSEMALSEKSYLKYGSAKEIEIKLEAPECVKADTEYNIKISTNVKEAHGILASITTEKIQFPHQKAEDIFRTIKKDGELERIVISNNEGKNEIAFASIAIASPYLNKESKVEFTVDGVAFISSRVNVIPAPIKKEAKYEQKK